MGDQCRSWQGCNNKVVVFWGRFPNRYVVYAVRCADVVRHTALRFCLQVVSKKGFWFKIEAGQILNRRHTQVFRGFKICLQQRVWAKRLFRDNFQPLAPTGFSQREHPLQGGFLGPPALREEHHFGIVPVRRSLIAVRKHPQNGGYQQILSRG
jgi:hypothetical protein